MGWDDRGLMVMEPGSSEFKLRRTLAEMGFQWLSGMEPHSMWSQTVNQSLSFERRVGKKRNIVILAIDI